MDGHNQLSPDQVAASRRLGEVLRKIELYQEQMGKVYGGGFARRVLRIVIFDLAISVMILLTAIYGVLR